MERQQSEQQEFIQLDARFERTSGPIPPPGMMRGYEEVLPGSADRILTMAEFAQRHRARYENRGMILAFLVALILIALSAYAISLGFASASVGVIVASIASTAGTFIYSNHSRARRLELREKRDGLRQPSIPPELPESANQADS